MSTLTAVARHWAEQSPERPFITQLSLEQSISYGELWLTARRLITLLDEYAVAQQDRVALIARNDWLVHPLLLACAARGTILVPIDPALHRDELAQLLTHCAPSLIVCAEKPPVEATVPTIALPELRRRLPELAPASIPAADTANDGRLPVLLIYTSGTTGGAKGVALTQRNLVSNARSLAQAYGVGNTDRFLCVLPTYHMHALMLTGMIPFVAGAQIFFSDVFSFQNAKFYWKTVSTHRITVVALVPSIMAILAEIFPKGADATCDTVRFALSGAAPLPALLWQRFERQFAMPVYQGYGLTETTCWATCTPRDVPRRYETVGLPLDCEIRIDASLGEILIRGPLLMAGYYRDASRTAESMTDGAFRTGDLGFLDDDGYLHVTGRLKELIIRGGVNIFPPDIDLTLAQHPAVEECKTLGLPDALQGERVHTAYVLRPDTPPISDAELVAWIRTRVSDYKVPDRLTRMGYLPKTATGKIALGSLRKVLSGELSHDLARALSPSDGDGLRPLLQRTLIAGGPLEMLAYWHGGRSEELDETDRLTLERIGAFIQGAAKLREIPPRLTLLFLDSRKPPDRGDRYFEKVGAAATGLGMAWLRMSHLRKEQGMALDEVGRQDLAEAEMIASMFPDRLFLTFDPPEMDVLLPALPKVRIF